LFPAGDVACNLITDEDGSRFIGRVRKDRVPPMCYEIITLSGFENRHRGRRRVPLMFEEGLEVILHHVTQHVALPLSG